MYLYTMYFTQCTLHNVLYTMYLVYAILLSEHGALGSEYRVHLFALFQQNRAGTLVNWQRPIKLMWIIHSTNNYQINANLIIKCSIHIN